MVSRVLFADTRARYGFDCSKTEPSPVPACRLIRCAAPRQGRDVEPRRAWARAAARAAPTPAGAVAAVRRRWRSAGPARSPSWSVAPVSKAPLRRELRRFRWRASAARPAAAARSQLEAREIRRARPRVRSSKTPRRRACSSRARAGPAPASRSTETAAFLSSARAHGDFGDLGRRRRRAHAWTRRHAGRRLERDDPDVEGNARIWGGRGHGEIFRKRNGERGGTMDVMAEDGDAARFDRIAPAL